MPAALDATTDLCRLLGDATRLRLLAALEGQGLTVAELVKVTGLGQSRVSTHLGRLREAGLVSAQPVGGRTLYTADAHRMPTRAARWWRFTRADLTDPLIEQDRRRVAEIIAARHGGDTWADAVAGRMARHYSPGRTWASFARGLAGLIGLPHEGHLIDIASGDGALAELIAPRVGSVTCVDLSPRVVAEGQRRLRHLGNVRFVHGDMQALPCPDGRFDGALLMGSLCYAADPARAIAEASRALRPGGLLVVVTLSAHDHREAVAPYDHLQMGFAPDDLNRMLVDVGLTVQQCAVTQREKRPPHFEVITAHGRKVAA